MSNQKETQDTKPTENAQTVNYIYGQLFEGCTFQGNTFQTLVQQAGREEPCSRHDGSGHEARQGEAGEGENSCCEPEENRAAHLTSHSEYAENAQTDDREIPADLRTSEARLLMAKLVRAGILDKQWQPLSLSLAEKGVLAGELSRKLGITTPWKVFGSLWNVKSESLRVAQSRGMDQGKTGKFLDRVKRIL